MKTTSPINKLLITAVLTAGAITFISTGTANAFSASQVREFVNEMVKEHDFDKRELTDLMNQAESRPSIIKAMTRPAEGKAWYEYRPIFVTPQSIAGGVDFWRENAKLLTRAEREFGVPAEIIVAIIGVETRYGQNTGSHRVLDALATLAFDYPKRADFFRGELEDFLLLAREENLDPLALKGSYAGAMGYPQFIPSSYRHYAVDFDKNGQRDLLHNVSDVIGSVANYFSEHKWQTGKPVAVPASLSRDAKFASLLGSYKPEISLRNLKQRGVRIDDDLNDDQRAALLEFETESGMEYWVGLDNFYVITRYNHSPLYAMAVYQLSQGIREEYEQR